MQGFMHS